MSENRHDPQSTPFEEREGPIEGGMEQMEVVLDAADFRPDTGLRSTPEMRWLPIAGVGLAALLGTAFAIGAAVSGSRVEDPELAVAEAVVDVAEVTAATAAPPVATPEDTGDATEAEDTTLAGTAEDAAATKERAVLARRAEKSRDHGRDTGASTHQSRAKPSSAAPAASARPAAATPKSTPPQAGSAPEADATDEAPPAAEAPARGSLSALPPPPEDDGPTAVEGGSDQPDTDDEPSGSLPAPPDNDDDAPAA